MGDVPANPVLRITLILFPEILSRDLISGECHVATIKHFEIMGQTQKENE